MNWQALLFIAGAALMVWLAVRLIKNNPGAFSSENLSKSIFTLGILALMLIGVVALCVLLLKG